MLRSLVLSKETGSGVILLTATGPYYWDVASTELAIEAYSVMARGNKLAGDRVYAILACEASRGPANGIYSNNNMPFTMKIYERKDENSSTYT